MDIFLRPLVRMQLIYDCINNLAKSRLIYVPLSLVPLCQDDPLCPKDAACGLRKKTGAVLAFGASRSLRRRCFTADQMRSRALCAAIHPHLDISRSTVTPRCHRLDPHRLDRLTLDITLSPGLVRGFFLGAARARVAHSFAKGDDSVRLPPKVLPPN
jgi:hypothetical protein